MEPITILQAIFLGVLQGLTEFLPVSSSGHLVVVQQMLGLTLPAQTLAAFDVALHAGTLVAVICYYWRDVVAMLSGRAWRTIGLVVLGTLPAAVIGIPLKGQIEALFTSVTVVGVAWIATGVLLWCTHYIRTTVHVAVRPRSAFMIGLAQAIAMVPGVSRSGSTIATGLFLKLSPAEAARYSFLLAMPAIGGSLLFEMEHLATLGADMIAASLVGAVSAGVVGYLAIAWLLRLLARGQLRWFGAYCVVIGVVTVAWVLLGGQVS